MTTRPCLLAVTAVALAGLLIGCTGEPSPTVTASPTDSPTPSPTASVSLGPTELITFPPSPSVPASGSPTASATSSPTASATATPTPAVAEILRFRREDFAESGRNQVDCTRPDFDGTIHLVWRILNATGVTLAIDGPGIYNSYSGTSGEADVPFACGPLQHTYTLRTTGGVGGTEASETRTIRVAQPAIVDFFVSGGGCSNPADTFPVFISYQIANATGVELRVDGELYATYAGKTGDNLPAGTYSCLNQSQAYQLTTTGGYGTPATMTLNFSGGD
jgi:hypothetical protein